jgi:CubicO group peptidase (beta-lactamase class C family)
VSPICPHQWAPYGAHWWGQIGDTLESLNALGVFRASGYEGQTITICPALDLVLVRLGKTPLEREESLPPWRAAVVQAFADAGAA